MVLDLIEKILRLAIWLLFDDEVGVKPLPTIDDLIDDLVDDAVEIDSLFDLLDLLDYEHKQMIDENDFEKIEVFGM